MVIVYFTPEKKWYKPWARKRQLRHNIDYKIDGDKFELTKKRKGKVEITFIVPCP